MIIKDLSNKLVFLKISLIAVLLPTLLNSCKPTESYILATQAKLRMVEREDHQQCVSQGVDFGEWNDISTELYWRCRSNILQSRKIQSATTTADIENNAMIKKIEHKVAKNIQRSRQSILSEIESDIETFDHAKCLSMGYNLNNNDATSNIQYYECRKKLIQERIPAAPAITHTYSASILPNKQFEPYIEGVQNNQVIKGSVDLASNMTNRFPACRNINVKSRYFNQCISAQQESVSCLNQIAILKSKKQLDDKIYCQQQSFLQFPDDYSLTRNKSAKEIEKMLAEERKAEIERLKAKKEAEVNKTLKFFEEGYVSQDIIYDKGSSYDIDQKAVAANKKGELLDKIQILKLREEFIGRCNVLLEGKISNYVSDETTKCLEIGSNWDKTPESDDDLASININQRQ